MSKYLKMATDAGDQFLTTLAESQESFLKTVATLSTPPPPLPTPAMPAFVAALPTMAEVTQANFSFAEKLLKQQKEFIEKLTAGATPASH
ncbi:MAG: hypothetical protein ABI640_12755 [Gammaproteobacteria bacterium]